MSKSQMGAVKNSGAQNPTVNPLTGARLFCACARRFPSVDLSRVPGLSPSNSGLHPSFFTVLSV